MSPTPEPALNPSIRWIGCISDDYLEFSGVMGDGFESPDAARDVFRSLARTGTFRARLPPDWDGSFRIVAHRAPKPLAECISDPFGIRYPGIPIRELLETAAENEPEDWACFENRDASSEFTDADLAALEADCNRAVRTLVAAFAARHPPTHRVFVEER